MISWYLLTLQILQLIHVKMVILQIEHSILDHISLITTAVNGTKDLTVSIA